MTKSAKRRLWPSVALALCLHAVVLLNLGYRIPAMVQQGAPDERRGIELTVIRPAQPLLSESPHRISPPTRTPVAGLVSRPVPPSTSAPVTALVQPNPAASSTAPSGDQASNAGDNVRAVLRGSLGCSNAQFNHLTNGEKQRCAQRALAQAKNAPDLTLANVDPLKRAYFDAVAAAYAQQTRGPPMAGRSPGIGCSIKFSGLKIVGSKAPPNTLSLGPCFISPPQGFLTEESGISPPSGRR